MKTHGNAIYDGKHNGWLIRCEPHVALRLKRVFAKIDSKKVGELFLSNTSENARDLEWFMERYPLECSHPDVLKKSADAHRDRESLVNSLLAGTNQTVDFPMALPPREYQAQAAAIARVNGGLLLADDVGLGKTVSAIAAFTNPQLMPCLVVALAHLPPQWTAAIQKFAPHLRCHTLKKGTPYDLRGKDGLLPDVIISSYHKLHGWAETLAPILRTVVFDECQELRHAGTAKWNAATYLAQRLTCRMGLSATPIYNYGHEMWNVMEAIAPGALGNRSEFITEWCHDGQTITHPQAFGQYMRDSGLMLRRTRREVGRELPGLTSIPHPIECDADALERLGSGCDELAEIILHGGELFRGQKMQAAAEFDMRMRQATGIAKAPYVAAFVRMMAEQGEPVVLYGWHREVYSIWQRLLSDLNPVLYTGTETPVQKERSKQSFIHGESKVLCISLRAGAGLDGLQDVCSTVVLGELDWSPGVHEQCIGRVYRDGQQRPVFAYFLLSNSGSDPVIADVLGLKTQQIDGIRNPKQELLEKLEVDPDHIKKLAEAYLKQRRASRSTRVSEQIGH